MPEYEILVDGLLDQVLEIEAVRVGTQEVDRVFEIAVKHQGGPRRDRAGDHDPARLEPPIPSGDDGNEHPFVDPEASEPFGDDHIHPPRRFDVHDVSLDHLDDVRESVRGDELLSQDRDGCLLDGIDAARTRPRREHAQYAAPRADIEDDIAGTDHRVDCASEGLGAHAVADHRAVHFELGVHRVRVTLDRRPHLLNVVRRLGRTLW